MGGGPAACGALGLWGLWSAETGLIRGARRGVFKLLGFGWEVLGAGGRRRHAAWHSSLHMHVLGRRQKVTHLAHAVPVWLVEQEKNIDGTTSDRPFAVEPDDKSRQVPVAPIGQRHVAWGPSVGCSGLQWASVGTLAPPPAAPGLDYGASNVPVWSGSMSALNLD